MKLKGGLRESKPCLFGLYDECRIIKYASSALKKEGIEYGDKEFVKIYCGLCIKAVYARAHLEKAENIKVVNTL